MTQRSTEAEILKQLIGEIEVIRVKRQVQLRMEPHPLQRRFSQDELTAVACKTYKNYLAGRSYRLPSHQMVNAIADYLECTLRERNDLLICAGYLPIAEDADGTPLAQLLLEGEALLERLPFPAVLSTRDWSIQRVNNLYATIWNIPDWEQIPKAHRHTLHFLFHQDYWSRRPAHQRDMMLFSALQNFWSHNRLYRYESWYRAFVEIGSRFEAFTELWARVEQHAAFTALPANEASVYAFQTEQVFASRFVHMAVGSSFYPIITAFIPTNAESSAIVSELKSGSRTGADTPIESRLRSIKA